MIAHLLRKSLVRNSSESEAASPSTVSQPRATSLTCISFAPVMPYPLWCCQECYCCKLHVVVSNKHSCCKSSSAFDFCKLSYRYHEVRPDMHAALLAAPCLSTTKLQLTFGCLPDGLQKAKWRLCISICLIISSCNDYYITNSNLQRSNLDRPADCTHLNTMRCLGITPLTCRMPRIETSKELGCFCLHITCVALFIQAITVNLACLYLYNCSPQAPA